MISPHTPPGTPLIVSWLPSTPEEDLSLIAPQYRQQVAVDPGECSLRLGQRVTLVHIKPMWLFKTGFAATIAEAPDGVWALECFDIATLPASITDLLQPVKEDA